MEHLRFQYSVAGRAKTYVTPALVGVVASGNLEVLAEHVLPDSECQVVIRTPIAGFDEVWRAVVADFVERYAPGGLRLSINDGGARPDMVGLRLAQAVKASEGVHS